jgi:hypothetical protein
VVPGEIPPDIEAVMSLLNLIVVDNRFTEASGMQRAAACPYR